MRQHSLQRVLSWQWTVCIGALLLGVFTASALALFVLEDSFIDARLLAAERALSGERQPLPQVESKRLADFPEHVQAQLSGVPPGGLREFRLDEARYLHLRALAPDAEGPRFLVFDAQDELRVRDGLLRAAPVLALLVVVLLVLAAWLAHRFVRRIERAAGGLLRALEQDPSADALRVAANAQPVAEFQRFGHALADSLEARLAALQREEDTLRFLAHELRTPLQSARLAYAALADTVPAPAAEARLGRALQRLERASAAVLWLGEATPLAHSLRIVPILRALTGEFAPLAESRGQRFRVEQHADLSWALPPEAAEAVLANLLINAIQHGAPGTIRIITGEGVIAFHNACCSEDPQPGFGLGLELARRLLARIGWRLQLEHGESEVVVRLMSEPPLGNGRQAPDRRA